MKGWTRTFAMLLLLAFLVAPFRCFSVCLGSKSVPACHRQHGSPAHPAQSCLQQHLPAVLDGAEFVPMLSLSLAESRILALPFFLVPEGPAVFDRRPAPPLLPLQDNSVLRL